MSETDPTPDNTMGTSPSEGMPETTPTADVRPPGETPPEEESPKKRRLRRAGGFASRILRRGAATDSTPTVEESSPTLEEGLEDPEPSPGTSNEPTEPEAADETENTTDEAIASEPEVEAHLSRGLEDYVNRSIHDPGLRNEAKHVLNLEPDELLKMYLEEIGIDKDKLDYAYSVVKSSNVRLIMQGLRDLGLDESKADEAHKIIMTEKGDIRIDHIVGLGFGADEAEAVYALLNDSRAHHVKDRLEKLGLDEDTIDQIMFAGDDEDKLIEANLSKLGLEQHIIDRILKHRENAKIEEVRKQELGYEDEDKLKAAHDLSIPEPVLKAAELGRIPIDLLIAAERDGDMGLKEWLATKGVELSGLPPADEGIRKLSVREMRKRKRELSKVPSKYPYDRQHPLYGLEYTDFPHMITRSETEYYRNMERQRPGWLRNSLIRPGSLPLPMALYHNKLSRPILDVANMIWIPLVGRRLLVARISRFERRRNPDEDYGALSMGREKRRTHWGDVKSVDKTITNDRSLLSWHRRHRNKGRIRRNPRLDLAQSIAEVKRDMMAFDMGRPELPSEEEFTYWRLREQLAKPIDVTDEEQVKRRQAQEKMLEDLRETHPEFEY